MYTLKELAAIVGGKIRGQENVEISGIASFDHAGKGDITFAADLKYLKKLETTGASAIIVKDGKPGDSGEGNFLLVDNPRLAFANLLSVFKKPPEVYEGIHPSSAVHQSASLGHNVSIGPFAVIGRGVKIGEGTLIYPGVYIGEESIVGKECIIYPGVSIMDRIEIGDRVIIGANSVIGNDGFGFVTAESKHHKIPHLGTVVIEDNVELGANVCVDRATTGSTRIGKGTKMDNLVQIAHNVQVGKNVLIVAYSGIAGSSTIDDNSIMAAQAGILDHCNVGKNAVVMSRALVAGDIADGAHVSGAPARDHRKEMKTRAIARRMPETIKTIKKLEKRIEKLEKEKE